MFLRAATDGLAGGGAGGAPGGRGAPGGLGADPVSARGVEGLDVSDSERYGDALSAPVLTPPDFRSLGIPPANKPPSCGAEAMPLSPAPPPASLPLRDLFPPGRGGARPPGGLGAMPGTGGAPPIGGPELFFTPPPPSCGAERSLT